MGMLQKIEKTVSDPAGSDTVFFVLFGRADGVQVVIIIDGSAFEFYHADDGCDKGSADGNTAGIGGGFQKRLGKQRVVTVDQMVHGIVKPAARDKGNDAGEEKDGGRRLFDSGKDFGKGGDRDRCKDIPQDAGAGFRKKNEDCPTDHPDETGNADEFGAFEIEQNAESDTGQKREDRL